MKVIMLVLTCVAGFSMPAFPQARSNTPLLEIRHITVGMTPQQTIDAAKAAGMEQRSSNPAMMNFADPTASGRAVGGDSGSGGHGLLLRVYFQDGKSDQIVIKEQGDINGDVGKDLEKKWGMPQKYGNPSGASLPWWGNPHGVWAELNTDPTAGFDGCHATIHASATPPKQRQGVPM